MIFSLFKKPVRIWIGFRFTSGKIQYQIVGWYYCCTEFDKFVFSHCTILRLIFIGWYWMNKKKHSQDSLHGYDIAPSFRSVGCKPCDFHRLKYSTSYNNFPKLKSTSAEKHDKNELNINLKQEIESKKKFISFRRKKS